VAEHLTLAVHNMILELLAIKVTTNLALIPLYSTQENFDRVEVSQPLVFFNYSWLWYLPQLHFLVVGFFYIYAIGSEKLSMI